MARSAATAPAWRQPLAWWRARWARWWQARTPPSDRLRLTQHNVYILPTRPGLMLAATLLVLLLASINYQLNLGFALTFLLAGSALASMHVGHANLRGLNLQLLPPAPAFAGQTLWLELALGAEDTRARHAIGVAAAPAGPWAWGHLPARAQRVRRVAHPPLARGRRALAALTVESRFPMGCFRVWSLWQPASTVLVYPAPEPQAPPLPGQQGAGEAGAVARAPASAEPPEDLRPYRSGDPLRQVLWKKAARLPDSGPEQWVSRERPGALRQRLWLDLVATGCTDREAALSRLCAWLLQAEQQGLDYGLRLPGLALAPDHGPAHQRRCLEALALC